MERIIFKEPVAKLQKLTAHIISLNIWNNYIAQSEYHKSENWFNDNPLETMLELSTNYWQESDDLIKGLNLQQPAEKILLKSLQDIQNETSSWIYHFKDCIFDDSLKKYMYSSSRLHLRCIVWARNCKIDYRKSASKMLSMAEFGLTEIQKFIIMSKYCMADELAQFPCRSLHGRTLQILRRNVLLNYWICKLKNEIFALSFETSDYASIVLRLDVANISVDVAMTVHCEKDESYGFDYFWNRLSADDQAIVAPHIGVHLKFYNYPNNFMSKMSAWQERQIICRIPDTIMGVFVVQLDMLDSATSAWTLTKDLMTPEQFHWLVCGLLSFLEPEHGADEAEKCYAFLVHVWDTAPDHLRNYAVEMTSEYRRIEEKIFESSNHSASSLKFFHRFLSLKSGEYRKAFMLQNGVEFASKIPVFEPNLTIDLIKLCLPNNDDRLEFNRWISEELKRHYGGLLSFGKIHDLRLKMQAFSPNDVETRELKIFLLTNRNYRVYGDNYMFHFDRWEELNEFIREAFEDDALSRNYKKELLLSFAKDYSGYIFSHYADRIADVIKVAQDGLSLEDMEIFKKIILDALQSKFEWVPSHFNMGFKKNYFFRSLLWFTGGNEAQARSIFNRVPPHWLK